VIPPTDNKFQSQPGTGEYAFGIKLNCIIAGTWTTRTDENGEALGDPHEQNPIKLPTPFQLYNEQDIDSEEQFVQRMQEEVAAVLNGSGLIVATVVDPREDEGLPDRSAVHQTAGERQVLRGG
jgi:hypothetical protein